MSSSPRSTSIGAAWIRCVVQRSIPLRTAATLALRRRCRLLLRALGEHVPPEWDRAEQQQANDAVGDVDLVMDEQVEADQAEGGPIEELFDSACSIEEELFESEVMQESPEDQVIAHNYTLKEGEVSAELAQQINGYRLHGTQVLNSWREGPRVQDNTCENDVRSLLRFMVGKSPTRPSPSQPTINSSCAPP